MAIGRVSQETSQVPRHVPPELVWGHYISEFVKGFDDPFLSAAEIQKGPDIRWCLGQTLPRPGWVVTHHDLIEEVLLDKDRFTSKYHTDTAQLLGVDWPLNPVELDWPEHRQYRKILQPRFNPSAVNAMDTMVRSVARELIADIRQRESCEFIKDFASLFPNYIFLELFGLDRSKLPQFASWVDDYLRGSTSEARIEGIVAIRAFLEEYVQSRSADPRDDLVTTILQGEVGGRPLNHGEVMGMAMLLFLGGLDTVLSSLGWYFRHLARDHHLQARLRERPADIPGAVEDFLRAYGVSIPRRNIVEDMDFHGVFMKKGDTVFLPTFLAGRDRRTYDRPDVVDPDRHARHLTLGTGVHNCLGNLLARREIKIVLEEWLPAFPNFRIPTGESDSWESNMIWAVTRLPLTWDQAA